MNDSEIIEKIKERDEKALAYLYDKYGAAIHGIIRRSLQSEKLAEEVLQQTFLKIWENMQSYDASKSILFTWMCRIARNSAIDMKRLKSYQNHSKTEDLDLNIHNAQKSSIDLSSIDAHNLISTLDKKHQIILDYLYLRGYTQSQVASELKIPLGTVKTRVRNAILELRNYLKSEEGLFVGKNIILIILITCLCL